MSNRSTPLQLRLNRLTSTSGCGSGGPSTSGASAKSTPELRRRFVSRTQLPVAIERKSAAEEIKTSTDTDQLLNTAFRRTATTPSTQPSTPRFRPKPTALNACYTPSSLYRSAKSTSSTVRSTPNLATPRTIKANDAEERSTEMTNLTVAVRVRPLNQQECTRAVVRNVVRVRGNELTVAAGTTADQTAGVQHSFAYDHVFYSCDPESPNYACQEEVFAGTAGPLIDRAFDGYNACLFAYGQTGSGKSYSMMGIEALDDAALDGRAPHPEAGIIPRFCHELFRRIDAVKDRLQAEIEVSYFEIFNEKIHDLLCVAQAEANSNGFSGTPMQRQALKVREHPIWGPYVVDLSVHSVDSYGALRNWLAVGNSQRATAATGMNDKSSRSHSIFNIVLNITELEDNNVTPLTTINGDGESSAVRQTRRSKISLVDLAGSERISSSGTSGDRMREGVSINKSLLTLGKVIAALADSKKGGHNSTHNSTQHASTFVPYRESVLTWLLRENLGGNSKTVMLATISPASLHVDETLATLRYACQARTIVNRVRVNESPHDKIIRELRAEVDRLKSLRNEYERQKRVSASSAGANPAPRKIIIETSVDDSEVETLRQQLAERERELSRAQKTWMERLREAEDQRKSELRLLRRKGLALELSAEQKQVCLVNLTADPILSGTLFYLLPPGTVRIGRTRSSTYCSQPDIVLDGPLVAYHHCIIENEAGRLHVTPESTECETFLNGELVDSKQQMFHGDRLVIGGSHYFRISNPFCAQRGTSKIVDFQLAHQEILQKQEMKLRRQLEEEKRQALSHIERERIENERNYKERLQQLELDQLKFQCDSEILDAERQALTRRSCEVTAAESAASSTPETLCFKSTLFDDIQRIMQTPSEESLHKTQLMVKEATQRCRSLGLDYEFRQSQVLDEFGIFRTVVLILDRIGARKAEWPTARLGVWLDIVRHSEDSLTTASIFDSVDIEWTPLDGDDDELNATLSDSLNTSRISLNLSVVKDALLKHPLQKLFSNGGSGGGGSAKQHLTKSALLNSCKRSQLTPVRKMLTYDDEDTTASPPTALAPLDGRISGGAVARDFAMAATVHVREMQRSALRLKRLCTDDDQENVPALSRSPKSPSYTANGGADDGDTRLMVRESLAQLDLVLHTLRSSLEREMRLAQREVSPSKTPKSVRFLVD